MKRLLVLMLVLCVAAAASATMSLRVAPGIADQYPEQTAYVDAVSSEISLAPSQTIWIGIYNPIQGVSGATQQGEFFLGIVVPNATGVGATGNWVQAGGQHLYQPPCVSGVSVENIYSGIQDWNGNGTLWLDNWYAKLTNGAPDQYNGIGVLDAKLFHCTAVGDAQILLFDADGAQIDSFIIHQVPEPVTIALLGLGGLFLRRRMA